ncbi:MAG: hypothetical protein ABIQ74_11955 [Chitinophagales bacterium]
MIDFKTHLLEQVWEKACSIPEMDPELFRRDEQGALICKSEYNNETSIYGWCFHHLKPLWEGGNSDLGNVTPLNCTNKILTLAVYLSKWQQSTRIWS